MALGHGKVAIITRTKNRCLLLRRAIESVLAQSFADWIHVIVNDGGNRYEVDLLAEEYAARYDGRLVIRHNEESLGMQNASNRGIAASESEYLNIHDDDDSWHPNYLNRCLAYLEAEGPESAYQGVIPQTIRIFERLTIEGSFRECRRDHYMPCDYIEFFRLGFENPFAPIALLYRRAVHQKIGLFDNRFTVVGDWEFNFRFLSHFEIGVLPEKLAYYHWRHESAAKGSGNTVTSDIDEHHRKAVEFKNHYLKQQIRQSSNSTGWMLTSSKFSYENNWLVWDLYRKSSTLREQLDRMERALNLQQPNGRGFSLPWKRSIHPPKGIDFEANTPPETTLFESERFYDVFHNAGFVSFDVFDTCLLRAVDRPIDVFRFLEVDFRVLSGNRDFPFAQARIAAERRARARYCAPAGGDRRGREEVTLEQIYDELCALAAMPPELKSQLMAKEVETERQLTCPNQLILTLYRLAKETGKQVLFVSDMYLPGDIVRELLVQHGYEADPLYISSETGLTKATGRMYDYVVDDLGCQAGQILHFGDNVHSDVIQAERQGWMAFHFNLNYFVGSYADQIKNRFVFHTHDRLTGVACGLARKHRLEHYEMVVDRERLQHWKNAAPPAVPPVLSRTGSPEDTRFWYTLGYELAGPIHFAFLNWILRRMKKLGRKHLYFLARDGYYLEKEFALLKQHWNLDLEAKYLFASRKVFNLAVIRELDEDAMEFLLTPHPGLRLCDFFTRIGLDARHYRALLRANEFYFLDRPLTTPLGEYRDPAEGSRLRNVFEALEEPILESARNERESLLAYFESEGFKATEGAIVDVGWQASSIRSLHRLLRDSDVYGFYFGTWKYARKAVDEGCAFESFFVHLDEPEETGSLIAESVSLMELLFTAPYPTIVGLHRTDAGWQPIHGPAELTGAEIENIKVLGRGAVAFVAEACRFFSGPIPDSGLQYVERALGRLLREPLCEEVARLGSLRHREGFGSNLSRPIVPKVPGKFKRRFAPGALQQAYWDSSWRKGYLTLLDRDQRKQLDP